MRFSTFTNGLNELKKWLKLHSSFHICLKSFREYWISIYNFLEGEIEICLAHPKYVKDIRGKKTDKKYAHWIADLYKHNLPAIATLIYRRTKASVEELELSMDGELSEEQAEKLRVIKAHYNAITLCKNDLEEMITELGKEYAHQQELIQTVPGLKIH